MRLGMDRSTAFSPTDGTLGSNAGARAEPRGQWARWSRGPLSYGPAGRLFAPVGHRLHHAYQTGLLLRSARLPGHSAAGTRLVAGSCQSRGRGRGRGQHSWAEASGAR